MFVLGRKPLNGAFCFLVALAFVCSPTRASAQINLGGIGGINLGGIGGGIGGNIGSNLGGGAGGQSPYLQRAQNQIPNPVNFWQYSQVTGVKPTFGTVTIYNQFGQQGMTQNPFQQAGIGGGGLGGIGGGQGGIGMTVGGDDPPQGVLLHVNYANMFLPNQQQINQQNALNPGFGGIGGGLGGIGGIGALGGIGGGLGALGGKFGGFNGDYGL
jgi:hypothetical protein